jgi:hypothetical protein
MAGVTSVVIDGTTYLVDDINAVDFSEDQGLTEQQQQQGRSNIGAAALAALAGKADKADLDTLEGTVGELSDDVNGLTEALADKASAIVDTASGAIASFPDGMAAPAKDVTIGIKPVQAGSGDPSPTNVRPISGWTGANVIVSPTTSAQDGETYPISWQSVAGTVYGGTLDVTTGLLTVTMAEVDLGTLNWGYVNEIFYSNSIVDYRNKGADNILCDRYPTSHVQSWSSVEDKHIVGNVSNGNIYIKDSAYTDAASFKAAMSGVQLVYELATPQTYQFAPIKVELLLGDNNVWTDTGDSTVTYRADTKLYIQKINAPTDDDMIADAQIASGKYFIVGGNLYKSTTTIPAGDIINPGSNCILTNLADALNALNT